MLNVHNIMEEQVISRVNELYRQVKAKGTSWLTCDCENCRLDTINYVLNRIPPRYIVSGRGVAYNQGTLLKDSQLNADIDRICLDGMKLVSTAKRPYHKVALLMDNKEPAILQPMFNFPTFIGNVFDGSTFEPITGANILLKLDGRAAFMMDSSWINPCKTYAASHGSFTFWVAPIKANEDKENKEFTFTIEASMDGYTPVTYSFSIPLVSETKDKRELNSVYSLKIQDIFLFRDDIVNDQE